MSPDSNNAHKKFPSTDIWIGLALGLAAFVLYFNTFAPAIGPGDSGELAAVAATFGIAHPTGYPMFTLLGWVFSHLPFGPNVIWKLDLFVTLCCSIAVFFFYRLFVLLLSDGLSVFPLKKTAAAKKETSRAKTQEPGRLLPRFSAAVAALVLAFSETYWSQAVQIEVYALHLLFLSLNLLLFVRALEREKREPGSAANRAWYAFAFVLGLSFSNHMTTILLAPGFLYLYFTTYGFSKNAWVKISKAAIPFLIGLLPYLYLPWRASHHPSMNWGDPVTLRGFWWHITGHQFKYQMFSSLDVPAKQLKLFLTTYPSEFGYAPLLFALLGLVYLFRRSRRMLAFSLLLFVGCLGYSLNYDIPDIDSYFLLAYIATAIWIAYGVREFLRFARDWKWLAGALCAALVLLPLYLHYPEMDESQNYAVEDYARNVLGSLDSGAVIFSDEEQFFAFPSYYLQLAQGVRPDVAVVYVTLLGLPWYYEELGHRYPWLIQNSKAEVDAFLPGLDSLSRDEHVDSTVFYGRLNQMIRSFIAKSYETRPVYVTPQINRGFTQGFHSVPSGLALRLFRDIPATPMPAKDFSFHPFTKGDSSTEAVKTLYAKGYFNQGIYRAMVVRDTAAGIAFLQKALAVKPDFASASEWLYHLQGR